MPGKKTLKTSLLILSLIVAAPAAVSTGYADEGDLDDFDMSLDDLFDTEVTSVSKRSEKVSDAAAAVYVITDEDLRRMGVTTIPEALRVVPGLQVARVDSNNWAISSRGFNDQFANKLLVMIDGRTVYTSLFSGVYWDIQDLLLQDVDRIEVIRGPGATIWGANAVNGVINIITKHTEYTQGTYLSAGYGNYEKGFSEGRYGSKIDDNISYSTYAKYSNRDSSKKNDGTTHTDAWYSTRGGFRADIKSPDDIDAIMIKGDVYNNVIDDSLVGTAATSFLTDNNSKAFGGNIQASWNHSISSESDVQVKAYLDKNSRINNVIKQDINSFDIDAQHSYMFNDKNSFIWGVGYRSIWDSFTNSNQLTIAPDEDKTQLFSTFVQDKITLIPEKLWITAGSKFEYNDYTGSEIQPSARFLWKADENHTFWGAVSHAIRTPSRAENGLIVDTSPFPAGTFGAGTPAGAVRILGATTVDSETVEAFELGYRTHIIEKISVDLSGFYNIYDNVISLTPGSAFVEISGGAPQLVVPLVGGNNAKAKSYGAELSTSWQVTEKWRLLTGYSFFHLDVDTITGDSLVQDYENTSPRNNLTLRSYLNLPHNIELDTSLYFVDNLPNKDIENYLQANVRIGWHPTENIDLSLVGENILDNRRLEFIDTLTGTATESPRSIFARATIRY